MQCYAKILLGALFLLAVGALIFRYLPSPWDGIAAVVIVALGSLRLHWRKKNLQGKGIPNEVCPEEDRHQPGRR